MNIKKNDQVLIILGDDKGKKGKVLRVFPKQEKVLVEGVGLVKKHIRPKKSGQAGQIVAAPRPMAASKMMILCPKCNKAVRVEYKKEGDKKSRVCKKCGANI